jgi:hypothetical protein
MNDRFRITKPCPDGIVVRGMIEERFRVLDAASAQDVAETLSIFGPGYNCRYTISRPKHTGIGTTSTTPP